MCNYIFDTGRKRPCPFGDGCTVKKLREQKWKSRKVEVCLNVLGYHTYEHLLTQSEIMQEKMERWSNRLLESEEWNLRNGSSA